ncbi:hypothetical protein KXX57_001741 [Aspergillus fumigatus]|uniref:Uncharacterized protein n=2 Tax=Aspergillus fumigatus TaxID=746128 RepID=Q4WL40_ASPFU|nr:hypothetical protein AFUA_1G00280 [Aspergillus fumigatus Af293]KAH1432856.1 hypothetical protein KXX32_001961 [Aspergillus fumigatus]EAL87742.1 hypothetical protein AFUA_1G00280 [Aspergillus fumigatus Af293]KAH1548455.1 hypothetical protein KXX57_001741 [Aspergillus fumigatus]KAH1894943.1 hypothetical protein KXV57_002037 [Aspergillus fumigatus]KAH2273024.1 hypothetical protein KXW02_000704 [Aspergillus fumigatus]
MADEFPRTAAYKKLVDKGLIKVDKDLPQYVQDVSKDLQGNARTGELEDAIAKVCKRIREIDSSEVFDVEGFEGNRQEAKDFLLDVLALAEKGGIEGAGDAVKKVSSTNITDGSDNDSEKESDGKENEEKKEKEKQEKEKQEKEKQEKEKQEKEKQEKEKKEKKEKEKKKKVSDDDSDSEYGSEYTPGSRGRGRSATPMNDEVREQLESRLKEYYDKAIEALRKYICGDKASKEDLRALNNNIRSDAAQLLKCKPEDTTNFTIPFDELKKMISKEVVTAPEDAQSDEYAEKLGEAKIKLYYLCRNHNIPQKWLSGLLVDSANDGATYEYRSIYNKENRSATEYWPYRTLQGNGFLVLFEKKKRSQKGEQSSFGVQVFDVQSKKFRVEMRKSIGSEVLNEWRGLNGTYKFSAADRKHSKDKDGEIEEVFFYTMTQKQTSVAHSSQPAHAEVCVKFAKSIWPRIIPKCDVQKLLPADEEVDNILEGLAKRDHMLLPREFAPNSVKIPMRPKRDGMPEVRLDQALKWRNITPIDPSVSNYSRDSVPPDFDIPRQTRESTFSPNYDNGLGRLRNEFDEKFSKLNSRMDHLEESVVTAEYLDNRFNQFFRQISEKLESRF